MKKRSIVLIIFIIFISLFYTNVYAHPGGKDKNGCHVCKTNCEKWNVPYGVKHCHNSDGSVTVANSNKSSSTNSNKRNYTIGKNSSNSNTTVKSNVVKNNSTKKSNIIKNNTTSKSNTTKSNVVKSNTAKKSNTVKSNSKSTKTSYDYKKKETSGGGCSKESKESKINDSSRDDKKESIVYMSAIFVWSGMFVYKKSK